MIQASGETSHKAASACLPTGQFDPLRQAGSCLAIAGFQKNYSEFSRGLTHLFVLRSQGTG